MSDPDLICPDPAYTPWWGAALAYDELATTNPEWTMPVQFADPETGLVHTLRMSASDMALHHLILFWGYHGGHL